MSVHAGPADWWTDGTGTGREFMSTKVLVQTGLVLNLDAGATNSYSGSGTTWTDLSGNGNNGTLTNGPTYDANNGGSIVFDGVNDYISVPHKAQLVGTQAMTLSAWVNLTSASFAGAAIIGKGSGTLNNAGFDFRIDSSTSLNLVKYFVIDQTTTISPLSTGTWYNIAAVQSSTKVDYYVNGVLAGTFNNSEAFQSNNTELRIARNRDTGYMPVKISSVQMYQSILSAADILKNFNALRGRHGV